tara:strand:+ start:313 stop:654 length:342 start_codon:yes stop_codon:yes gene_type:complete
MITIKYSYDCNCGRKENEKTEKNYCIVCFCRNLEGELIEEDLIDGKIVIDEYLHGIEITLREAEDMMRALYPNFNDHRNAERFIVSCLKANEALRQIQRGNMETVTKYWREEE